jgi:hypothetical protein
MSYVSVGIGTVIGHLALAYFNGQDWHLATVHSIVGGTALMAHAIVTATVFRR